MANIDDPRGFILRKVPGKTVRMNEYRKTANEVLYIGDLVKRVAAGTVQVCGAGVTSGIVGVCMQYHAAADTSPVLICDDPDAEYYAQATTYALTDDGINVDVAAGSPDTNLKRSGMEIDMSTGATTATLPFKVLGLAEGVNGGNVVGTDALIIVKLNATEGHPGSTGLTT